MRAFWGHWCQLQRGKEANDTPPKRGRREEFLRRLCSIHLKEESPDASRKSALKNPPEGPLTRQPKSNQIVVVHYTFASSQYVNTVVSTCLAEQATSRGGTLSRTGRHRKRSTEPRGSTLMGKRIPRLGPYLHLLGISD